MRSLEPLPHRSIAHRTKYALIDKWHRFDAALPGVLANLILALIATGFMCFALALTH